uniref:peptidylprolyl isomerase n=1 Tax=Zea mays TaxID=4577 RepID=A0A804PFM9_MAIZE
MGRKKNPIVFLDVSVGDEPDERMIFELFADVAPLTTENFRALCTGELGIGQKTKKPLCYKGTLFHRVIKGFMAQGGDIAKENGSGGENIYSGKFTADTGFKPSGSQFCITFKPNSHLDRKHTVFGKLVVGSDVLKRIEQVDVQSPDSTPVIPVTIVNCGELIERKDIGSMSIEIDKKRAAKSKLTRDITSDEESNEGQHKRRRNKSSKRRRKKRRYSYSESDSSSESETESSDYESDSDTYSSDSSDVSSSSDDRRRRRKRHSKKNKRKHSRRKRDHRRERRRRKRGRKSKQKSKRIVKGDSEAESTGDSSSEDARSKRHRRGRKFKASSQVSEENLAGVAALKDATSPQQKSGIQRSPAQDVSSLQNGEVHTNGVNDSKIERNAAVMPVLTGNRSKSRSQSMSVNHSMSKSMSISPRRSPMKRSSTSPKRSLSRSPVDNNHSRSPIRTPKRSVSRSPARRQIMSRSPARSPPRNSSRSLHISRSPVKAHRRSISRSSARSMQQRSPSRSLERTHVRKSISPSPPLEKGRSITRTSVVSPLRSVSRSPARISRSPHRPSRRSPMRSPRWNIRRSLSRSPARIPRRSVSRSPVRGGRPRRNISRSPSPHRRVVTPPNNGRSPSRSGSPDGSPKRIRRGRGFTQRYSYARQYRSPSADRSHRYGGRNDRDRYMGYRGSRHRSPPRRYRSPPRGRVSSPRRGRYRRRSRSASRSPVYRERGRGGGYSKSPIRSSSPPARKPRSHGDRARSVSRSHLSGSVSRSPPVHHPSPPDSPSVKHASDEKSQSASPALSLSGSPNRGGKKGLVSYGDGSPDSAGK